MHARGWSGVVIGAVLAGSASAALAQKAGADPSPRPVELAPLRDQLTVLVDAEGGTYLVYAPRTSDARVFYGSGKTLYEQVRVGRSADGDAWSVLVMAPRLAQLRPGEVRRRADGTLIKVCGGIDDRELTELTGPKAEAVLGKVALRTTLLVRRPHVLARDDKGTYYYVDRLSNAFGGKGYRVFVGRRGAMKQVPLVDVAADSRGEVFSTRTGSLRLVAVQDQAGTRAELVWIRGERRTELVSIDVDVNSPLIFTELGIYKQLGTICDNV